MTNKDKDTLDQLELRKWSVEKALEANAGKDVVEIAQAIHVFVGHQKVAEGEDKKTVTKIWNPTPLTSMQKAVMTAMITRLRNDEKINGVQLAKDLKIEQSGVSLHLRNLIKLKYVGREGNKYWPLLTPSGQPLPPSLIKCPDMPAKGYKPLTHTIGETAKIKRAA